MSDYIETWTPYPMPPPKRANGWTVFMWDFEANRYEQVPQKQNPWHINNGGCERP